MKSFIQNCLIDIAYSDYQNTADEIFGSGDYTMNRTSTKSGKNVVILEPSSGGKLITIIENSDIVHLAPYKFSSTNWYENITVSMIEFITRLAYNFKGLLELYDEFNDCPIIIKNRVAVSASMFICKKNSVPNFIKEDEDDYQDSTTFKIIKPIKEWLQENIDILTVAQEMKKPDNLNYMGNILIQKRAEGSIQFEIFKNLLVQIVILGADDVKVKNMYNFIT